ncbi:hypothetical protein FH968_19735 [Buttiauxella sp. B2]|uniref:hypothetical protein n=1 Tax=Buttiauxella sp. B2 TaxID=2587812 RepID=UPI0011236B5B|nr:hypothetical protein [Buttiauxella sp. B2]TNV16076.1 hypothetical protein FH968_19735 [Buttiauxella sp. B2]
MKIDKDFNSRYLNFFCQSPVVRFVLMSSDIEEPENYWYEINCTEHDDVQEKIRRFCINYGSVTDNYVWDGQEAIQCRFSVDDYLHPEIIEDAKSIVGDEFDVFAKRAINEVWSEIRIYFLVKSKYLLAPDNIPGKPTFTELDINFTDDLSSLMQLSTSDKHFVGNSILKQISNSVINNDVQRLSLVCSDLLSSGTYSTKHRHIATCINRKLKKVYNLDTLLDALAFNEFMWEWESQYLKKHFKELTGCGVRYIVFNFNYDYARDFYEELFKKESEYLEAQGRAHESVFMNKAWDVWLEELCFDAKTYDREHGRFN